MAIMVILLLMQSLIIKPKDVIMWQQGLHAERIVKAERGDSGDTEAEEMAAKPQYYNDKEVS